MLNANLARLGGYPFDRLRALLDGIDPPAGVEPVVLSIGDPQHPPPAMLAPILAENAHLWNRYPPPEGTPALRQAIADWLTRRYTLATGAIGADTHVLPVPGTREALFMTALIAVPRIKGGGVPEVLIPNPHYHIYSGAAVMAAADPLYLPTGRETGFLPDLESAGAVNLDHTALVYLCSPSNPEGAVASLDYLKDAIVLARQHGFVLAADECYAEIYGGDPPPGLLEAAAALGPGFENIIVFHSLSKRSSAAGLRSGFVAGDPTLVGAFKKLRGFGGATIPLPIMAASEALWRDEAHVEENRALYREKFDAAEKVIGGRYGFYRPAGGFFLWLEVGDGEAAARRLWAEAGLRVLPGAYMAHDEAGGTNPGHAFIRIALIHESNTITGALERLIKTLG